MNTKMPQKKRYFILLCLCLLLAIASACIYVFFDKTPKRSSYDKYTDITSWCTENASDSSKPTYECKALLLDIKGNNANQSCFEMQIITNDKELKDYEVCGSGDSLEYASEILAYKKFMPIDIVFSYSLSKSSLFEEKYTFEKANLNLIDESYLQGIINEDIANLVTFDINSTTIRNGVDFCPKSNQLPDYVTDENKQKYTKFIGDNTLTKDKYTQADFYDDLNSIPISLFFRCDSSSKLSYDLCNNKASLSQTELSSIPRLAMASSRIKWGNNFDPFDTLYLKETSFIYDSMFLKNNNTKVTLSNLDYLIQGINVKADLNEDTLCGLDKIYSQLESNYPEFTKDRNLIKSIVLNNLDSVTSYSCTDILSDISDPKGLYLKLYYSDKDKSNKLFLYDRCNNLNYVIK